MKTVDSTTYASAEKPVWQSPKLQELGNIRRFVQTGNANGKSGTFIDGSSMCGGEAMGEAGTCQP
jgi:hypothetical protein